MFFYLTFVYLETFWIVEYCYEYRCPVILCNLISFFRWRGYCLPNINCGHCYIYAYCHDYFWSRWCCQAFLNCTRGAVLTNLFIYFVTYLMGQRLTCWRLRSVESEPTTWRCVTNYLFRVFLFLSIPYSNASFLCGLTFGTVATFSYFQKNSLIVRFSIDLVQF